MRDAFFYDSSRSSTDLCWRGWSIKKSRCHETSHAVALFTDLAFRFGFPWWVSPHQVTAHRRTLG